MTSIPPQTPSPQPMDLLDALSRRIVGQDTALQQIAPYVHMFRTGLNPSDRPAGIFLLLGPTGTGKTRTVEALAEFLHGSPKKLLKIDCAEYQSDHEVAKLIGAPPGYVGHRETKPLLSQEQLLGVVTPECDLAIVLFDEIEKAAPAFTSLLLGVLDKATLRAGDNAIVNFERSFIFLTSNLGAREMLKELKSDFGFQATAPRSAAEMATRLESLGVAAVRKRFSPEFVNRIDAVITYRPLDAAAFARIVDHHIEELQRHVQTRLGDRSFAVDVSPPARRLLAEKGASQEFGARELRRTIHRMLTQPLAALVASGRVQPGDRVVADLVAAGDALALRTEARAPVTTTAAARPVVLALDDNQPFVEWLERVLADTGVTPIVATTARQACELAAETPIDLAILDLLLPDGDGLSVAQALRRRWPALQVVLMTGMELSADEAAICEREEFQVLRKPFFDEDVAGLVRARLARAAAADH